MEKSTISMAIFNSYVCLPEGMCLFMIYYMFQIGDSSTIKIMYPPASNYLARHIEKKKQLCSPGFRSDPQPYKRFSSTDG